MIAFLINTAVVIAAIIAMEGFAVVVHRYIMHGPIGWGWHRSHHEETEGWFETNDLYAVVFSFLSGGILVFGNLGVWPLQQVGIGLILYGVLYFIVHDGLVHQRWPFRYVPKHGYLKRLVQAHKMHHAVNGRDGCVSFGFLYAPPIKDLKSALARKKSTRKPRGRRPAGEAAAKPALRSDSTA